MLVLEVILLAKKYIFLKVVIIIAYRCVLYLLPILKWENCFKEKTEYSLLIDWLADYLFSLSYACTIRIFDISRTNHELLA